MALIQWAWSTSIAWNKRPLGFNVLTKNTRIYKLYAAKNIEALFRS